MVKLTKGDFIRLIIAGWIFLLVWVTLDLTQEMKDEQYTGKGKTLMSPNSNVSIPEWLWKRANYNNTMSAGPDDLEDTIQRIRMIPYTVPTETSSLTYFFYHFYEYLFGKKNEPKEQ